MTLIEFFLLVNGGGLITKPLSFIGASLFLIKILLSIEQSKFFFLTHHSALWTFEVSLWTLESEVFIFDQYSQWMIFKRRSSHLWENLRSQCNIFFYGRKYEILSQLFTFSLIFSIIEELFKDWFIFFEKGSTSIKTKWLLPGSYWIFCIIYLIQILQIF